MEVKCCNATKLQYRSPLYSRFLFQLFLPFCTVLVFFSWHEVLRSQWLTLEVSLFTTVVFVSGTETKTRPEYTEVKQEDSMDDVVEEKRDLKSFKGKIQTAFSAKPVVASSWERYCMWILSYFFQLQMWRRGGTVFLTKRQQVLWTRPLKRKIKLAQVRFEYYINF